MCPRNRGRLFRCQPVAASGAGGQQWQRAGRQAALQPGARLHAMQIFVRTLPGRTLTLDVAPGDTVAETMAAIHDAEGVDPRAQRLVCGGHSS